MSFNSSVVEGIFKPMIQSMMNVFNEDLIEADWANNPSADTLTQVFFKSISRYAQHDDTIKPDSSIVKKVIRKAESLKRPAETDEPSEPTSTAASSTFHTTAKEHKCMWTEGKKLCDSNVQKVRQLPNNKIYCSRHYKIMCKRLGVVADIGSSNKKQQTEESDSTTEEQAEQTEEQEEHQQQEEQPEAPTSPQLSQESAMSSFSPQIKSSQVVRKIKRARTATEGTSIDQ